MKTATALSSIAMLLLAPAALGSPPTPRDIEACCCCVPGKNVISCTNAIKAKDCVCLAVVCPKGAPTIWENPKRPQATTTTTLVAMGQQREMRPFQADAGYNTAVGGVSSYPYVSVQAPLKDILITARGGPAPTLPVMPAEPSQMLEEWRKNRRLDEEEEEGEGQQKRKVKRMVAEEEVVVKEEEEVVVKEEEEEVKEEDGANEMAPCCCCDVRHDSYSCHMRKKGDCFCGQVMCPSRAPTVWNDAEPTAVATERIGMM